MRIAVSRAPGTEREVAPLELFFDLVYVFAIGQLSHHLVAHVDLRTSAQKDVSRVVERCPTGALQYRRLDGRPGEQTTATTTVTPVENGPLAVRGDLVVRHEDGTLERLPRAALCRCGQSKNKPFCDNSHIEAGFQAPAASPAEAVSNSASSTGRGSPD